MIRHGRHVRPRLEAITSKGRLRLRVWSLIIRKAKAAEEWRQGGNVQMALQLAVRAIAGRYMLSAAQVAEETSAARLNLAATILENPIAMTPKRTQLTADLMRMLESLVLSAAKRAAELNDET